MGVKLDWIFRYPNVVGYSNTPKRKIVKGVETDEWAIRIYVSKKLPESMLKPDEIIPKMIGNMKTDVVEIGRFRAVEMQRTKLRPSPCGVSIGRSDVRVAGTLGWYVVDSNLNIYMMSNYHVLGSPTEGEIYVVQPSLLDGGTSEDVIGRVYYGLPIKFGASEENKVDVAIAEILDMRDVYMSILEIGGVTEVGSPVVNEVVQKMSRTTGYNVGKVIDDSAVVDVYYGSQVARFTDVFIVEGVDIVADGDSGSPVLGMDNTFYGLLFAGNDEGTHYGACKALNIESELSIALGRNIRILRVNSPKPYQVVTTVVYKTPEIYQTIQAMVNTMMALMFLLVFTLTVTSTVKSIVVA